MTGGHHAVPDLPAIAGSADPTEPKRLHHVQVDLWTADLELPSHLLSRLYDTLASNEREKAGRFYFRQDRDHYVAGRGFLRQLLARSLGVTPKSVRFVYGPYGKPALAETPGAPILHFNVSHSAGVALFAIGRRSVGVDVEAIRELSDMLPIAERFFSQDEVRVLRTIPNGDRAPAFFRCWTAKEAYIKARGEGLSMPLDRFAVSITPAEGPVDLRVFDSPAESQRFDLFRLTPRAGFIGAVAIASPETAPIPPAGPA